MASGPGRNRRLESAVSILLLVVLFLIALAVLIKQADVDMTRFGLGAAAQPDSQKAPDLAALASGPPGRTPDAFKELSSPLVYTAGNLYEKINGKAPLYLDAGFLKLFTQRFVSRTDENLWMEIYLYDMAGLKNAFSVYSVQKRADVETLSTMQFAYKTTNALYFVHGRYYVELLGSAESPDLLEAMKNVADSITAGLKVDEEARIPELDLFPTHNLVSAASSSLSKIPSVSPT